MLALAGPSLPSSAYRPLIRHALSFVQTRHNTVGVAGWKQNKQEKNWKKFNRGHTKGIFHPLSDDVLSKPAFADRVVTPPVFPDFSPDVFEEKMIGQPTAYTPDASHPFISFGQPKTALLESRILSRQCTIIRQSTLDMAEIVQQASSKPSADTRVCYTGAPGAGKTHALLQTVQHCRSQNWIILYVPRAYTTVDSTTVHSYDLRTQTYLQPVYAYQTLQRMLTVNRTHFSLLATAQEYEFEKSTVPAGSSLAELVQAGLADSGSSAPQVLDAIMTELQLQESYPVLLAIDDFQALFTRTFYKDPHFKPIQSYHLSMSRLLMQFASGQRSFARGAFFGALCASNTQFPISNDVHLALDLDEEASQRYSSPYDKQHKQMLDYLNGIMPLHIPVGMTPTEAAGLFELWMGQRSIFTDANDELFLAKYAESDGNPRQFVWSGLLKTLQGAPLRIDKRKPYAQYHLP